MLRDGGDGAVGQRGREHPEGLPVKLSNDTSIAETSRPLAISITGVGRESQDDGDAVENRVAKSVAEEYQTLFVAPEEGAA